MARQEEKNKWTKKEKDEKESKERCGYGQKRGCKEREEGRVVNERMPNRHSFSRLAGITEKDCDHKKRK